MKTKGMGIALLSAAALLGSAVAQAELPWTYAEFGYSKADGSDSFETDAWDLKGSVAFLSKWHASLQYQDGEVDSDSSFGDADFDGFQLVAGAHPQLTPNTQVIFDLTYLDYDVDGAEGGDASEDGYGVGFGLRHAITDKLEISAEAWYIESNYEEDGFDEDYNNTSLQFGGRYNWTPAVSTGLTVFLDGTAATSAASLSDDVIRFDVRWSWDYVL
jgi:hypothetical protein